ncbi:MAG: PAS domain S-box protein [Syntrophales bacterium]|nr:PAS domain S-box protein [Syntrophales bacterium]
MAKYARMTKKQLIERLEELDGHLGTSQRVKGKRGSKGPDRLRDDESYEILAENTLEGVLVLDFEGKILFATPASVKMAGFKRAGDFIGTNLLNYVAPDYRNKVIRDQKTVMAGGGGFLSEYKGVTKDGKELWVEGFAIIAPFRGEKAALIILRDITDRIETGKQLRGVEQKYLDILENIQESYFETDLAGNYTFVNDAVSKILGHSREKLLRMNTLETASPEMAEKGVPIFQEVYRTGVPANIEEYKVIGKDGRPGIRKLHVSLRRNSKEEPIGFRGISIDVTQQVEAERALRNSEERYRTILEGIDEGYFEIDLAGNYTFVNDALCRIMGGYTKEEIIGLNNRAYTDSKTAKKAFSIFREVYETGKPANLKDYEVRKKDGSIGIRELHVSLMRDPEGKPCGFRGLSRDVTEHRRSERALRESEERYRTILEDINEGYYELDLAGMITFVNDAGARILGFTQKELVGMSKQKRTSPEMADQTFKVFNEVYRTGKPADISGYEVIAKDGNLRILSMHVSLMHDSEGNPVGFRGVSRDVTQQKQAERALQESEERYRNLFEKTASPIMITDPNGLFIDWNDAALTFLECTREELVKRNVHDFLPPESQEAAKDKQKDSWRLDRTGEAEYLIGEKIKILELSMTPAVLNGRDVVFGVGKDVTERKQTEERLAYMATHDQLTDLPNRALFGDRLELELEKSRRNNKMLAVILFDLDRFKEVNDTLGHGVGDLLLKELGHRLRDCLRKSDTVARMGGDEFFMLLCDISSEKDADIIADKILDAIRRPFLPESNEIHMTASLGVAFYPKDGDDVETLIQKADIAMYEAKGSGRDRYGHYLPFMENVK